MCTTVKVAIKLEKFKCLYIYVNLNKIASLIEFYTHQFAAAYTQLSTTS